MPGRPDPAGGEQGPAIQRPGLTAPPRSLTFHAMIHDDPGELAGARIAIMGGGGKTGLLVRLGREIAATYSRVLLTPLTQSVPLPGLPATPLLSTAAGPAGGGIADGAKAAAGQDLRPLFRRANPLYVMGDPTAQGKLAGISAGDLEALAPQAQVVLFECDGARNLSLKAHDGRDPVVPALATHVIIVVGADVVGTRLSQGRVHRPGRFATNWGISPDWPLSADFIAQVVTSSRGYLSKVPHGTRRVYYVNKADSHDAEARLLARAIAARSGCPAFFGSLRDQMCQRAT